MTNTFSFDYRHFQKVLTDAVRRAFLALRAQHNEEEIYAFGLEAHTEFEGLYPFILTEETLNNTVMQWMTSPNPYVSAYRELSEQDLRAYLRYFISADRDYDFAEKYFHEVHKIQSRGIKHFDGWFVSARKVETENEVQLQTREHEIKYRDACIASLQRLDNEGVFGIDEQRNKIVLMLVFTGHHLIQEETLAHVTALNSKFVVDLYKTQMAQTHITEQKMRNT